MQKIQREQRIKNQLKIIQQTQEDHPNWRVVESTLDKWKIQIKCDITYPYHGPPFHLLVEFGKNYPYENANISVVESKKIFHPNIRFDDGFICQVVVKKEDLTLMIKDRVNQFMSFLKQPNPLSTLNNQAGQLYIKDKKQYHRTALAIYRGISLKN